MPDYITALGDAWDLVAYKTMGDEMYMHLLIEANQQHIDTIIFPAGVKLIIPEAQSRNPEALPPWKRGAVNAP